MVGMMKQIRSPLFWVTIILAMIPFAIALPFVNFVAPTLSNASFVNSPNLIFNATINTTTLNNLSFEWNGTNFSMYDDSLLVMFNFNDFTKLNDTSNYTMNASCTNCPQYFSTGGRYGGRYQFDGTNDYFEIQDDDIFNFNVAGQYTWAFWVNVSNFTAWSTLWSQSLDDDRYFFIYTHSTTDPTFGSIINGVSVGGDLANDNTGIYARSNNNSLTEGENTHIVVTYNGSASEINRYTIYINGINQTHSTIVYSASSKQNFNPTNIRIGSNQPWGEYYNGSVDEARMYNRTFSQEEVTQLYFTNLQKNTNNEWQIMINQSKNASTSLEEGNYTARLHVQENSGAQNQTELLSFTIRNDTNPPKITINSPTNTNYTQSTVVFNITTNETVRAWYTLNGGITNVTLGTQDNLTFNHTNSTLIDGNYTVIFYANDSLGNTNTTNISFRIDSTPPNVTALVPSANITYNTSTLIEMGANSSDLSGIDTVLVNITLPNSSSTLLTLNNTLGMKFNESYMIPNLTGRYNLTYIANDSLGNSNNSETSFFIAQLPTDTDPPLITINSPQNTSYIGTTILFNITLNENGSAWMSLNGSSNTTFSTADNRTFTFTNTSLLPGGYNVIFYANDTAGNLNNTNISFTLFADSDNDSVVDINDTLEGNESDVITSGITTLNITVGGNTTNGTFVGEQMVQILDGTELITNFTHNFSANDMNLSKVEIEVTSNAVVINMSGQLSANEKKSIYLSDDSYAELCVKDAEIGSASEISNDCSGTNETDFTSCIGNGTGITLNSITCIDLGSRFFFSNLTHSGVRGTQSSPAPSSGGGGGGGGGSVRIHQMNPKEEVQVERFRQFDIYRVHFKGESKDLKITYIDKEKVKLSVGREKYEIGIENTLFFDFNEDGLDDIYFKIDTHYGRKAYVDLAYGLVVSKRNPTSTLSVEKESKKESDTQENKEKETTKKEDSIAQTIEPTTEQPLPPQELQEQSETNEEEKQVSEKEKLWKQTLYRIKDAFYTFLMLLCGGIFCFCIQLKGKRKQKQLLLK